MKNFFVRCFLEWPESLSSHFGWLAPLFGRLVIGWIFLWRGWSDVHGRRITSEFGQWGFSHTHYLSPAISGIELAAGIFLLLGFITRLSAGTLAIIMAFVLVLSHRNAFGSLTAFVDLQETQYFALFLWLAVAGAGPLALDNLIKHHEK
jgi:putative oxidoreductase